MKRQFHLQWKMNRIKLILFLLLAATSVSVGISIFLFQEHYKQVHAEVPKVQERTVDSDGINLGGSD